MTVRAILAVIGGLTVCMLGAGCDAKMPSVPNVPIETAAQVWGPVDFDHDEHKDIADGCTDCHHDESNLSEGCLECHRGRAKWDEQSCDACHTGEFDRRHPRKADLKAAYHGLCASCHEEGIHSGLKGCNECHTQKKQP